VRLLPASITSNPLPKLPDVQPRFRQIDICTPEVRKAREELEHRFMLAMQAGDGSEAQRVVSEIRALNAKERVRKQREKRALYNLLLREKVRRLRRKQTPPGTRPVFVRCSPRRAPRARRVRHAARPAARGPDDGPPEPPRVADDASAGGAS
jgi:hypothetical protein